MKVLKTGQIDELIHKQIQKQHLSHQLTTFGINNGVLINCGNLGDRFVYINSFIESSVLKHELCLIDINLEQDRQKYVERIPLVYSDQIKGLDGSRNVKAVQVDFKKSLHNPNLFIIKISTWKNRENIDSFNINKKDILCILYLDPQQLSNIIEFGKNKNSNNIVKQGQQTYISLIQMGRSTSSSVGIVDFKWWPNRQNVICCLSNDEVFDTWDLQDSYSIPIHSFRLRNLRKGKCRQVCFPLTSFCFLNWRQDSQNINRFSIFFLDSEGSIFSLFPFIIQGTRIPIQLHYKYTQNNKSSNIYTLFKQSINRQHIVNQYPPLQDYIQIMRWNSNNLSKIKTKSSPYKYTDLALHCLNKECILMTYIKQFQQADIPSSIMISMLTDQFSDDEEAQSQLYIHQILEWKIKKKEPWLRHYRIEEKLNKRFFFFNGHDMFYLELQNFYNFAKTGNLTQISSKKPIQQELVLRIPQRQQFVSFAFKQESNMICFIRKTEYDDKKKQKIKFEIHSLDYLGLFDEIFSIDREFRSMTDNFQKLVNKIPKKQAKISQIIPQLSLNKEEISKKQESLNYFKNQYEKYCLDIRNYIDKNMSQIKYKYQTMQSQRSKFQSQSAKKQQLERLMYRIKKNKQEIHLKLQRPISSSIKKKNTQEVNEYAERIQAIKKMQQMVKSKNIQIDRENSADLDKKLDQFLKRIQKLQKKINQAKQSKGKIKREYL